MNRIEPSGAIAVTTDDVRRLCDFLYRHTGMLFAQDKRYYVDRRLAERMAATQSTSFSDYFATLRANAEDEVEHLINSITVNETYFYREDYQLRCLSSTILDMIAAGKRPGDAIRIWSVACSTGEEPYSIAIWLLENWGRVDQYAIEIIGSDIDTRALRVAEAGVYGERSLARLRKDLVARYFNKLDDGRYRILPALTQSMQFTRVNVIDPRQTALHRNFDVVFCRNILMYFDDASRRLAAENLYDSMVPGGFLCLGHTESMSRASGLFEVCRFADAFVYRRPQEQAHE